MEGTRTRGRQSATMIDWMKSNDVEYEYIKERAYDREDWHHWRPGPAKTFAKTFAKSKLWTWQVRLVLDQIADVRSVLVLSLDLN